MDILGVPLVTPRDCSGGGEALPEGGLYARPPSLPVAGGSQRFLNPRECVRRARAFAKSPHMDIIRGKMRIGPIELSTPFCQAGLAGYSDRAMRIVARRRGCPYAVTEALLDTILLSGGQGLRNSIDIDDEDHPVAGQVIGAEPESMARAATLLAN